MSHRQVGISRSIWCITMYQGGRLFYLGLFQAEQAIIELGFGQKETLQTGGFLLCRRAELNRRHVDFQSTALPTELQRHAFAMRVFISQLVETVKSLRWTKSLIKVLGLCLPEDSLRAIVCHGPQQTTYWCLPEGIR